MMPPWTFQSPRNKRRAEAIASELLNLDADILCLEKVFDSGARKVLAKALDERYPYRYGPANSGCSLKLNSGVWVLSRLPLSSHRDIRFRDCAGIDCFARKGAIFLTGTTGGHRFQLVATHLQGGAGPKTTPKRQPVRGRQIDQIRDELLMARAEPGVPLFLCGDFVTPRFDEIEPEKESDGYRYILATLGVENGKEYRITLDERRSHNDLAKPNRTRTGELDYIFVNPNGTDLRLEWSRLILRHPGWDGRKNRHDLSYRYAVSLLVEFR